MRHGNGLRKFSRTNSHRKAMFKNLASALIERERIETTLEKAKDLRRVIEKLVTLAGTDTIHRRRQAFAALNSQAIVAKLFNEIGPRFEKRTGGYTRVVRSQIRPGDAAQMAVIEFVEKGASAGKTVERSRPTKKAKTATKAKEPKAAAVEGEKKPKARKTKKSEE